MTMAWQASTAAAQHEWAAGDFHQVGMQQVIVGELLCDAVEVHAGEHVLDVAAGAGNTALAAARRYAEVTAADLVPALLERAQARAAAEGLRLATDVSDAQHLPYAERRFDVVTSTFGVMFAADQRRAADELLRVCRHGGRIALASWRPDGLVGEMLGMVADFSGGPGASPGPTWWGTEEGLDELFGAQSTSIRTTERMAYAAYRSTEHCLRVLTGSFGPIVTMMETLTPEDKAAFRRELAILWARHNRAQDSTVLTRSTYLEAVIARR